MSDRRNMNKVIPMFWDNINDVKSRLLVRCWLLRKEGWDEESEIWRQMYYAFDKPIKDN